MKGSARRWDNKRRTYEDGNLKLELTVQHEGGCREELVAGRSHSEMYKTLHSVHLRGDAYTALVLATSLMVCYKV